MRKGSSVAAGLKKDSLWQSICKHNPAQMEALCAVVSDGAAGIYLVFTV